jgi:hypothetical protein
MTGPDANFEIKWGQLVARAWADDHFRQRLIADPAPALEEHGLVVPAGVNVRVVEQAEGADIQVVENADKFLNLVLPVKPGPEELVEEDISHPVAWWWGPQVCFCRTCAGTCNRCGACARCERCH